MTSSQPRPATDSCDCSRPGAFTRRTLFAGLGAMGALTLTRGGAQLAFGASGPPGDVLVAVFLRGGMDGMSVVPPVGEAAYYAARPTIAIPADRVIRLDPLFGLHPKLAPLRSAWTAGDLAVVHAAGDPTGIRSHFEAEDQMERAAAGSPSLYTGWIDRHFTTRAEGNPAFPSIAVAPRIPTSLVGPAPDAAIRSVADFRVQAPADVAGKVEQALKDLHADVAGPTAERARETLRVVRALAAQTGTAYVPGNGAVYPATEFARGLSEVARLIRAGVGLEAACVDLGGWDMHVGIGNADTGAMATQLTVFAEALAAFYQDLGALMGGVTVVTMSEFGRTFAENGSNGTDHGYGNAMFVLGKGVKGKVYARWPGLAADQLDKMGDLKVTTDYRDVLAEIVSVRMLNSNLTSVFPGFTPRFVGLAKPR
jgi:uncharacterized protein (DUF1501 family)